MSSIIVAAILVAFIILICTAVVFVHNKDSKKMADELMSHFSRVKAENRLVFLNQETLKNLALGLDEVQRKCLIVRTVKDRYDCFVFQLDELKNCSREKYIEVSMSEPGRKKSMKDSLREWYWNLNFLITDLKFKFHFMNPLRTVLRNCQN